jgi:hypothetical protein
MRGRPEFPPELLGNLPQELRGLLDWSNPFEAEGEVWLGFGRMIGFGIEAPILLANLV